MKRVLTIAIVAGFLIVCTNSLAVSTPSTTSTKDSVATLAENQIDNLVFKGVVKKLDTGTALYTEKAIYPLMGGDFDMIVGKSVHIIGRIVKDGNVEKISVARVQFDRK
jgi:hypothetical protein